MVRDWGAMARPRVLLRVQLGCLLGLGWVSSAPRWVSADDDGLTVGDAAAEDEEGAGDFKLPPDFNSESLMDDGILDELKRGAKDGSDRVDSDSVVTTGTGSVEDLLKDAGFGPSPPWQSGKRAVRKAARCRACEVPP